MAAAGALTSPGVVERPVDFVGDDLGGAASIGSDHRYTGGHTFDHDLAGTAPESASNVRASGSQRATQTSSRKPRNSRPRSSRALLNLGVQGVGVRLILAEHRRSDDQRLTPVIRERSRKGLQK